MPSATRNTKANNGTAESDPGKPRMWLNTSADNPMVAAKDSTLAPTITSGATTALSSAISTSRMTSDGLAPHLGFGPERETVLQHRAGQCLDVIGHDVVATAGRRPASGYPL